MSPASVDEIIGRLLDGRYRVEARIARGGMATVYRAMDSRLDRPVAVKIMHPHLAADSDFAARFVREARAVARLNHVGVVSVYDQGSDDGLVYLAMEYVPGRTLRDVISDEAPLPPLRSVRLMERVLDALAAAHAAKIVHRDVKPENVLIGPDNVVKVADFGLARAITADSTTTASGGLLIGTVSYLAPELVLGENADARSDVYAAGIVLFELLTGEKPHRGETPIQVAYRHVNDDVPPPSSRDHQLDWPIPDFVDALVARATTREPAMRPTDAGVLLRQLRRVRSALEQGVRDDPDLADDLRPQAGHREDTLPDAATAAVTDTATDTVTDTVPGAMPVAVPGRPSDRLSDPLPDPLLEPVPAGAPATAPPADGHEHTLVVGVVSDDKGSAVPDDSVSDPPATARRGRGAPAAPARRRRRGMWWLVVVLLLALLAGLGGWWFGVGRFTDTPDLVRMSEA
ncbi:MAG: protein kinase, partial [Nocardioidaceae bacterium]|nr:protein kinase [Nocardioidaceae bacterium]